MAGKLQSAGHLRVLVCGGRDYLDNKTLRETLNSLHADRNFVTLIHGAARGADSMAAVWADDNSIPIIEEYRADWNTHGKKAGILRNIQMLEEGKPDLVVAFPGGRGTAHMIEIAKKAGVEVIEVEYTK